MKDNYTVEPQWITARDLAAYNGWPEGKAEYVLKGLVERGMAECDGLRYRINGKGLTAGEYMGTTVPLHDAAQLLGKSSLLAKK